MLVPTVVEPTSQGERSFDIYSRLLIIKNIKSYYVISYLICMLSKFTNKNEINKNYSIVLTNFRNWKNPEYKVKEFHII